jgi:hypothetical protein
MLQNQHGHAVDDEPHHSDEYRLIECDRHGLRKANDALHGHDQREPGEEHGAGKAPERIDLARAEDPPLLLVAGIVPTVTKPLPELRSITNSFALISEPEVQFSTTVLPVRFAKNELILIGNGPPDTVIVVPQDPPPHVPLLAVLLVNT